MIQQRILPIAGIVLLAAATAALAAMGTMSVQVRETQVREKPSFLGKIVTTLSYGDRVEIIEEKGAWQRSEQGWLHKSALSSKTIVLKAGAADVQHSASGDEVALAGKGFNKEVEDEYRQRNSLDYSWVDRMETYIVSQDQMMVFMQEGGIIPAEGDM